MPSALALAAALLASTTARADDEVSSEQAPKMVGGKPSSDTMTASERASERFEVALKLFDEGDFAASLTEFRAAHAVKPTYQLRFNIGAVCLELRDYACALTELRAYLAEGGENVGLERRELVRKDIARAASRVAHVEVVTTAGAEVSIDDQPVGTAPLLRPLLVNAGRRKVTADKVGWTNKVVMIEVPATDAIRVVLDLHPLTSAAPSAGTLAAPSTAPSTAAPPSRWTTASFIGLGAGGLLLGSGIVAGLAAQSERAELEGQRFSGPTPPEDMQARAEGADRLALAANVVGIAGIATLGITVAMTLLRPTSRQSARVGAGIHAQGGLIHGSF